MQTDAELVALSAASLQSRYDKVMTAMRRNLPVNAVNFNDFQTAKQQWIGEYTADVCQQQSENVASRIEIDSSGIVTPDKQLSNLEQFHIGSQYESDGNFAAACAHYSQALQQSSTANENDSGSDGNVHLSYPIKLAIRKRIKWLEWFDETDARKKKMRALDFIQLLYYCRNDETIGNEDLLGACFCFDSMGLLDDAKSCYEHYINGTFEPSEQILAKCNALADDLLKDVVERFQLSLDSFQATSTVDQQGMNIPTSSADTNASATASEQQPGTSHRSSIVSRKRAGGGGGSGGNSHSACDDDRRSSSSSGGGSKEQQHSFRQQPCTELGFDATACMLPLTPRRVVHSFDDAHSNELRQFCYTHPVVVLRDMHAVLNMNLINYSTKAIVDVDADCTIEERTQFYQPGDLNLDLTTKKPSWDYYSEAGSTTVKHIATYQLQNFLSQDRSARTRQVGERIHFGTNLDLSDAVKWHAQLDELDKLPPFLRVKADTNMLSYIDYELLGVNTVQMYIKVGGNRTPGHQENNNFCSVNVNIGPGDCEWFCVDYEHWDQVRELCQKNDLDFLKDAWWPFIDDLTRAGVPVHKFIQKPGDIVWVNIGTVHWVQALSVCNNIAWNVGPLTAYQLKVGIERYEFNRVACFQSIIPMVYLMWSLARSGSHVINRNGGAKLFSMLKTLMRQSLEHCCHQIRMLERVLHKQIIFRDRNEASSEEKQAQYCWNCDGEVFNILYCIVRHVKNKSELKTYCYRCATANEPTLASYFIVQQYSIKELCTWYERFRYDCGGRNNTHGVTQAFADSTAAAAAASRTCSPAGSGVKPVLPAVAQCSNSEIAAAATSAVSTVLVLSPVEQSPLMAARAKAKIASRKPQSDKNNNIITGGGVASIRRSKITKRNHSWHSTGSKKSAATVQPMLNAADYTETDAMTPIAVTTAMGASSSPAPLEVDPMLVLEQANLKAATINPAEPATQPVPMPTARGKAKVSRNKDGKTTNYSTDNDSATRRVTIEKRRNRSLHAVRTSDKHAEVRPVGSSDADRNTVKSNNSRRRQSTQGRLSTSKTSSPMRPNKRRRTSDDEADDEDEAGIKDISGMNRANAVDAVSGNSSNNNAAVESSTMPTTTPVKRQRVYKRKRLSPTAAASAGDDADMMPLDDGNDEPNY